MKSIIGLAFLLFSTVAFAQTGNEQVQFASHNLEVPQGCKVKGTNEVQCDNYSIAWRTGDKKTVEGLQHAFLEMRSLMGESKKKKLEFYLLDTKTKGYKVSYKSGKGTAYQLSTTGTVNGAPVWVLLTLNKEAATNDDIPEFARQVIRFVK